MKKKVVMVGSNHAGIFAQTTLHRSYKDLVDVRTYDSNTNTSFLESGMSLWIGQSINKSESLFYLSPEQLRELGSDVYMEHEVISIDFNSKTLKVKDLKSGEEKEDNYDEIIIAVGSWPIIPPIEGIDLENVLIAKRYQHAQECMKLMEDDTIEEVVVVGAGYVGIELVEAFNLRGKKTTLVTDGEILNRYYDKEFVKPMRERLSSNGIKVVENERVQKFVGTNGKVTQVVTDKGTYEAQAVLMSVGVNANTKFLKGSGLEMDERGVIKVNQKQETNIQGVYAIGDCAQVFNNATGQFQHIGLATNAVKTGIIAAHNIGGTPLSMNGVQGSNAIHICGLTMASTGLSEDTAKFLGYETDSVIHTDTIRLDIMPTNNEVTTKVVWDKNTKKILGAQIMSDEDITLALHTFSLAIEVGYTIDKLATLDLFFLPNFNKPDNFITKAGLLALDKLLGK